MKNIKDYLNVPSDKVSLFDIVIMDDNGSKWLKYNYEEIVKDYIMEHELYKYPYNENIITQKVFDWFRTQNYDENKTNDHFHKFSFETEVAYFHSQHLDLFMLGELNHES